MRLMGATFFAETALGIRKHKAMDRLTIKPSAVEKNANSSHEEMNQVYSTNVG